MSLPAPPSHRRSPVKHVVHSHVRERRPVRQYVRGHGKPEKVKASKHGVNRYLSPEGTGYEVSLVYDDRGSESLNVDATNLLEALDKGFDQRKKVNSVRSITLRSLSI